MNLDTRPSRQRRWRNRPQGDKSNGCTRDETVVRTGNNVSRATKSVALGAIFALLLSACGRHEHLDSAREGPLIAHAGGQSFAAARYASTPEIWQISFGSGGLCSLRDNTLIEIEGVSWAAAEPEPLDVEPWLRIYNAKEESADAFIALLGPAWESSRISQKDTVYEDDIAGYKITQTCEQLDENKRTQMTDLFFLVTSGSEGAEVPEAYVDYKANGRSYRLIIDYGMIMCGPAISEREPEDGSPGDCQP